ncbi:Uncharacterised protein [uncultured archaeon]|nr:Uncharacterised protein [uncultured archaeon]
MSKMMVIKWILDGTKDKKKLAAWLITAATVLFLIFAGSPFANINTNTASAQTNPYASVGTLVVNTNNTAANFTLTGPATYSGNGTSWSQADAPIGTYTITFDPIPGYDTPPGDTQTLVNGGTITFTGLYNLSVGTITVTTNNSAATFTVTGPATYTGSGTSWSQADAPAGIYTITFVPIPGYDTPASDTQTLVSKGTIAFTGTYNLSVGTITVTTNNSAATFNITGPATYTGSGTSWSQSNAPIGTYTITYDPVSGYDTPPSDTQTLVSKGTIAFTGTYNLSVGTITVTTNNSAATFTITGPATYTGSGISWSQSNAPIGTYTITFDPIPGYDTPASDTQTLTSKGTIAFTGTYNKTIYTVKLQSLADAYISQFKQENNINYGTIITMNVQSFSPGVSGNLKNERSFVKFNTSSIPAGSTILSTALQLYAMNVSNSTRNYKVQRVGQNWDETTITWNNMPSVASSVTAFANTPLSPGWMSWTVTPDVQAWVSGNYNYGWQISDQSENSSTQYTTTFYTREYSDTSLRPTLVVQYTVV